MAVFAISDSNLRRQDMEGAVSGTFNIGAGPGPATFGEIFYQGVQAWGRKPNSVDANRGFLVAITSTDMTVAGDDVIMFKGLVVNYGQASTVANGGGLRFHIGSATGDHYSYVVADEGTQGDNGEFEYPPIGGWLIVPIDPNVVAWRDFLTGSAPTLTAITQAGVSGAITTATVSESIILDAIDIGPGLFGVGGDGGDPDGVWSFFVTDDEGTATGGRFGHVTTLNGIIYVFGTLAIGQNSSASSTLTVFNDANQVLVFPGGLVDAGWNRILIDTATAATGIDFATTVFKGQGRSDLTHFFSTIGDVDATNEEIDIVGHGYATGDAVRYTDEGGSDTIGLTDGALYFVERINADSFSLHAVGSTVGRQAAFTAATPVGLSAGSTGENHKFVREPQTLPDLTQTGINATASFQALACTFDSFGEITLTTRGTLLACSILGIGGISLVGGTLDGCTCGQSVLEEGEALVTDTTLANIRNNTFVAEGRGHAVEIDTAGTFTYSGNLHTGYGPDRAQFGTTAGVNGASEVITTLAAHGFSTGDHVYYNDEGGAVGVGLTDGAKYYVNNITANTLSLHVSKTDASSDVRRVNLTASGAETHSLYSGTAAVVNSSGGAVTIDVASGGDSPTIRNTPGSTTTVNNDKTITLTGMKDNTEVRVYDPAGSTTEVAGIENATAGSPDDRFFAFTRPATNTIDIRVFNVTHLPADILGFVVPGSDTSLPIQQIFDPNYDNP